MRVRELRDPFCSLSHWFGLLLSLVGSILLLSLSSRSPGHVVPFALYGLGLVSLYLASATYHSVEGKGWWKVGLRKLDHAAIYLMIAGSYAPLCLIALRGTAGTAMMWGQALFCVVGIALTMALGKVPGWARVVLYLGMGWMALLALPQIRQALPSAGLTWLFMGGVLYSIGAIIYVTDYPALVPGRFSAHDLWHVFVLAGSACHFVLMESYIAPIK